MRIVISGIPIDVQKKNIKNMHLQVKPPDGHVVISAPLSVDDKAIEAYARTQLGFIKRAIAQFQDQLRASKRQYVSGETMYIWGKQYFLVFKPDNQKNSFEIQNQNIVLSMSAKSTVKQRDAYVKEEYRKILKEEIEKRLPKWETQTGLKCDSWVIFNASYGSSDYYRAARQVYVKETDVDELCKEIYDRTTNLSSAFCRELYCGNGLSALWNCIPFRLSIWRINTDMLEQMDFIAHVIENYKDGSLREN